MRPHWGLLRTTCASAAARGGVRCRPCSERHGFTTNILTNDIDLLIIDTSVFLCGTDPEVVEMTKTAIAVKRFLDIALIVLVLGAVGGGLVILYGGLTQGVVTISVPAQFDPAAQVLRVHNSVLGAGHVGAVTGEVSFKADLASWPAALYILGLALALAPAFVFVILLRRIVATVVAGDPFAEANIDRIRAIGALAMALELLHGAAQFGLQTAVMATSTVRGFSLVSSGEWNFSVFIYGAVIIMLAEVFRYGRQLQSDVDLTV